MAFIALLSVLLDRLLGEPQRWHPLVGFGKVATAVENMCLHQETQSPDEQRRLGILSVAVCIAPFCLIACAFSKPNLVGWLFQLIILYLSIGAKSLEDHALKVQAALERNDILAARTAVSQIVSRDTSQMSPDDVSRATIESVLENGSDAIFGALFWFVLLGAPGAVLYRLVNTLDAMWGYKNERYLHFGWAAARLDDLLNFIPARLTAFSYMMAGDRKSALYCWKKQAPLWYSPNAGPVMATGAGALAVQLGGPARYDGNVKERPTLGIGRPATPQDISRAVDLVGKVLLIWVGIITVFGVLLHA